MIESVESTSFLIFHQVRSLSLLKTITLTAAFRTLPQTGPPEPSSYQLGFIDEYQEGNTENQTWGSWVHYH